MNKAVPVYAILLVLGLGLSWNRYTSDETQAREGIVLLDVKKDELQKLVYGSPDLTVNVEIRKDDLGSYPWIVITEVKKKRTPDGETREEKTLRFRGGADAEKLLEKWQPLMAMRQLDQVTDEQQLTFGLKEIDTTIQLAWGGKSTTLDLGGETYGTKDRYVRDQSTGQIFVVSKDAIQNLKFARTKLKENRLTALEEAKITSISLAKGSQTASWSQKNIDDRAAAYWERDGATKDASFDNWLDKALKLKSTDYVQPDEEPKELVTLFEMTLRSADGKTETLQFLQSGEDWYARSSFTRALVKVNKASIKEVDDEVLDVIEGKAAPPPSGPDAAATPPTPPTPPGLPSAPPGGSEAPLTPPGKP